MPVSVTMPRLGESVTEGTVTRWLKKEGDQVVADEPLLEVSTDKVDTEIPAPASGVLQSIKVAEDETVEVGAELAVIGDAADSAPAAPEAGAAPAADTAGERVEPAAQVATVSAAQAESAPVTDAPAQADAAPPAAAPAVSANSTPAPAPAPAPPAQATAPAAPVQATADEDGDAEGAAYVTPLVRRLAADNGVDLSAVRGTGLGGRVRKQDVLDAAQASGAPAQAATAPSAPAAAAVAPAAPAAPPAAAAAAAAAPAGQPLVTSSPAPTRSAPVVSLKGRTEKLSRLRQVIAARMVESLQTSAQLTTVVEVDVTKIARLRQQAKAAFEGREGVKLS
ncbi:MAG: biotin/lipoyl-containing protein, partial [Actinomycetota bacterium]